MIVQFYFRKKGKSFSARCFNHSFSVMWCRWLMGEKWVCASGKDEAVEFREQSRKGSLLYSYFIHCSDDFYNRRGLSTRHQQQRSGSKDFSTLMFVFSLPSDGLKKRLKKIFGKHFWQKISTEKPQL